MPGCGHRDPLAHLTGRPALGTDPDHRRAVIRQAAGQGWQLWELRQLLGELTPAELAARDEATG